MTKQNTHNITFLTKGSQHEHLKLNTKFGHLSIASGPYHLNSKPKVVYYDFICDCGKTISNSLLQVKFNNRKNPSSCGCQTSSFRKIKATKQQPVCKICKTDNPNDFEYKRKTICKECRKTKKREESRAITADPILKRIKYDGIRRSNQSNYKQFIKNILRNVRYDDLPLEYIVGLYESQNGCCKISGIKLQNAFKNLESISIDRIDNAYGHKQGNIQLVCKFINLGRRDSPIELFLNSIKDASPRSHSNFDIIKFLKKRLMVIKSRCHGKHNTDLDIDYLTYLFENQCGNCALTKLPMTLQTGLLACSVDRIDSKESYLKNNIQLVRSWVNVAKGSHTNDEFSSCYSKFLNLS